MAFEHIWSRTRRAAATACLALGLATGASATTLNDVTVGSTALFGGPLLDVIAGDDGLGNFVFEATDFLDVFVFLDFDDVTESSVETSAANDLDITDAFTGQGALGSALDFAFDYSADTLSILYDLSVNDFSADALGVAVLYFLTDIDATFGFADLDFEQVEMDLFGATATTPVIPLPATLPLALAGLLGFALVGRRRNTA